MATTYTATAGDTLLLRVTVTDEDGAALALAGYSAIYRIATSSPDGSVMLTKTTPYYNGIMLGSDNVVEIEIEAGATTGLSGSYYHELQITSPAGIVSTVLADWITYTPELIAA